MAKDRSFASKVAKSAGQGPNVCAECGQPRSQIKVIQSTPNPEKDSFRFKEKMVSMCKCNENDYLS